MVGEVRHVDHAHVKRRKGAKEQLAAKDKEPSELAAFLATLVLSGDIEERKEEHGPGEIDEITGRESALPGDGHLNEGDDEAGEPPGQNPLQTDFPIAFLPKGDQEHQNQDREADV